MHIKGQAARAKPLNICIAFLGGHYTHMGNRLADLKGTASPSNANSLTRIVRTPQAQLGWTCQIKRRCQEEVAVLLKVVTQYVCVWLRPINSKHIGLSNNGIWPKVHRPMLFVLADLQHTYCVVWRKARIRCKYKWIRMRDSESHIANATKRHSHVIKSLATACVMNPL